MPVTKMLDTRTYSRQELINIFNTERLDAIKAKIKRQGYEYTTCGRGKDFTLTIISMPHFFRNFCIEELGFAPQTDFRKLKRFLYKFFLDKRFQQLSYAVMAREMPVDFYVSQETIGRWVKHLIDNDLVWRDFAEYNYYASVHDGFGGYVCVPITKQVYSDAWSAYWQGRKYSYGEAINALGRVSGGQPYKVGKIYENAFAQEKLERLKEILIKEINIDE